MLAVVEAFGGSAPAGGLIETLDWLDAFSESHWNHRRGQERNLAETRTFHPDLDRLIVEAAGALGLRSGGGPRFDDYDEMLVLGGLVGACVLRPRLARKLLTDGVAAGEVTALGGFREFKGDESTLARRAGIPEANEATAMLAGMRAAFDLGSPLSDDGDRSDPNPFHWWRVTRFAGCPPVTVVAAPSADPLRRVTTPDTYAYWATEIARLPARPTTTILLITSATFVPYQHAHAIRTLAIPYGAIVDTVGTDPHAPVDEAFRKSSQPAHYLQEMRSTIRALRDLASATTAFSELALV